MKVIHLILSIFFLASLMMLSSCSSDSDSTVIITPITADDYTMTIDVNKSSVSSNWQTDANTAGVSATVTTDGAYGNCVINDTSITYNKTVETKTIDSCTLSIDNSIDMIVSINALYWKQVSAGRHYTTAIKSDGTLWSWGDNSKGQLGDGSEVNSFIPIQEATHTTSWSSVSGGVNHTSAIKTDGTLWSWGDNTNGQLGDGGTVDSLTPIQEDTNSTLWSSVSASGSYTVAIKTDGTLWAWGDNFTGQLGNGTTTDSSIPTQEDTNSTSWSSVSTGYFHTMAIKTDGTLWSWGDNSDGQLGDGGTVDSLTPIQEDTNATNWSSSNAGDIHSIGIKSDGTLWAWGRNGNGQLGDGTSGTNRLSPTQEDTNATDWSSTGAGFAHTVASKSDGTLWAWGYNDSGQLGDGTSGTNRLRATQEDTKTINWSSLDAGSAHTVAMKSDGTIWAWGYNGIGQLGDGTNVNKHIPTLSIIRQ